MALGMDNQPFACLQREFYSSHKTYSLIGDGFTDILHPKNFSNEKCFHVPAEFGTGLSRRIPLGKSIEMCLHDMKPHRDIELSGKTQGDVYILMLCLGESVSWRETTSGKTMELEKDYGILYRAYNINETGIYHKDKHYQGVTLYLSPEIFDRYFDETEQGQNLFGNLYPNYAPAKYLLPPETRVILSEALRCDYTGSIKAMYLESKAVELVAACMNASLERESVRKAPVNLSRTDIESINQAKEILDSSLSVPVTISALSRSVLLNETKLKKGFRYIYGKPVYTYLLDKRMETARVLLETKDMSVTQVADFVGYGSSSSFSKAFTKKFGFHPSECI